MTIVTLPNETLFHVFDALARTAPPKEILRLKEVCKHFKVIVEGEFNQHRARLDLPRILELDLIVFNSRPLWQKVAFFILASPGVFFLCVKKVVRRCYRGVIKPILEGASRIFWNLITKIQNVADGILQFLLKAASFAYEEILTPIGKAVRAIAKAFFHRLLIPVCRFAYQQVLTPLGHAIRAVARWTFEHGLRYTLIRLGRGLISLLEFTFTRILPPIGRVIRAIAKLFFVTLPQKFYQHVLTHLGRGLMPLLRFIFTKALPPIFKVISVLVRAFFVTIPKKIYQHILTPLGHRIVKISEVINSAILIPIINIVQLVYNFVFVVCPPTFNRAIIIPLGQRITAARHSAYLMYCIVRRSIF